MICYCIFPTFPEYNSNLTLTDDVIFVNQLKGAIVYYDGSHNDSRMCISIAVTAARLGATVANHTRETIQQFWTSGDFLGTFLDNCFGVFLGQFTFFKQFCWVIF